MGAMKTPATRDAILEAALEAFTHQGYAATSIRDLGARLGITSAALYYHFPHKLAVLEAVVAPYLDAIDALLEGTPRTPSLDDKRRLLAGYLEIVLEHRRIADLVGRERELEAHPTLGPRMTELVEGMVARLAAPSRNEAARLRATAAIGALRRPVLRPEIDAGRQVDELLEAAMAALGG